MNKIIRWLKRNQIERAVITENGLLCIETFGGKSIYYAGKFGRYSRLPHRELCNGKEQIKLTRIADYIFKYGNPYPTAHEESK